MKEKSFKTLGKKVTVFKQFETFNKPLNISTVEMVSDEVTAVCPVTGQPDWYTVHIKYHPARLCIESKTMKLYLQSFRNKGLFCEAFASQIAQDVYQGIDPFYVVVKVIQKPRGGVAIMGESEKGMLPK
jgi:7-cyano-7-deazaguanine reductase